MSYENSVRETIRMARAGHTQTEFATQLGTSQSLVSKYESGKANPPAEIIDKCMSIIHDRNGHTDVTLGVLEKRMRKILSGPSRAELRSAFAALLDAVEVSSTRRPGR